MDPVPFWRRLFGRRRARSPARIRGSAGCGGRRGNKWPPVLIGRTDQKQSCPTGERESQINHKIACRRRRRNRKLNKQFPNKQNRHRESVCLASRGYPPTSRLIGLSFPRINYVANSTCWLRVSGGPVVKAPQRKQQEWWRKLLLLVLRAPIGDFSGRPRKIIVSRFGGQPGTPTFGAGGCHTFADRIWRQLARCHHPDRANCMFVAAGRHSLRSEGAAGGYSIDGASQARRRRSVNIGFGPASVALLATMDSKVSLDSAGTGGLALGSAQKRFNQVRLYLLRNPGRHLLP